MSSSLSSNDSSLSSNHSSSGDDDHITKDKRDDDKGLRKEIKSNANEGLMTRLRSFYFEEMLLTFVEKKGESWMKPTASSCMVVSTLTATGVFSASFSVPGVSDD
ncbi:hypothetical protein JHK85_043600 [Glycine max]|nr:hypothetical protein JHK85_043600 [Glycine max]